MFSTLICAFMVERFIKVVIWVFISILPVIEKGEVFVISLCGVLILQFPLLQSADNSMALRFGKIVKTKIPPP